MFALTLQKRTKFHHSSTSFRQIFSAGIDENLPSCDGDVNHRVIKNFDSTTGICHIELNRPSKLNAFDLAMFEAISNTAKDLKSDKSIRAIILSGKGSSFSTGLDVKAVLNNGNVKEQIDRLLSERSRSNDEASIESNLAQRVSIFWRELNVPVIAVLHGMCYGAGLQIALGADFRYAKPDCKLSIMESKWGLIPDMGASIFLRELVGIDVAKELAMTGKIIDGKEAAKLGLVTRLCEDPMKEAQLVAEQLVERSPDAMAASKKLFQRTWTSFAEEESLRLESDLQRKLLMSWNQFAASGRSAIGWRFPYWK